MDSKSKNYYEILEIPSDASPEDVYQGYVRAKNAYSQDSLALYSLMTKDECDQILNSVEEAYSILSDPNKRKQYDQARGLNSNMNYQRSGAITGERNPFEKKEQAQAQVQDKSMHKLVAKKRFELEYQRDEDFEKEIEQATDFNGEFLKKIREYKNVDLARMGDMTKVSKTYIRYIEEEDFEKLPARVYVRGFVYQYAKCLKLNSELVANSYIHLMKEKQKSS